MIIQYGEPLFQYRIQPKINEQRFMMLSKRYIAPEELLSIPDPLDSYEYFSYKNFTIKFQDLFLSRDFKLFQPKFDRFRQEVPLSTYQEIQISQPEIYESEYDERRVPLYSYIAEFKGDDAKNSVEIYYGMPISYQFRRNFPGTIPLKLKEGVFLFDSQWHKLNSIINHSTVTPDTTNSADIRSIFQSYPDLRVEPGTYNLAIEFEDDEKKIFGSTRHPVTFTELSGEALSMSSLVLGIHIDNTYTIPNRLKQYNIKPLPSLKFKTQEKIKLYFEAYNLTFSRNNRTNFDLVINITFDKGNQKLYEQALNALQKLVRKDQKKMLMSVSAIFSGESMNDIIFQELDVSSLMPGLYILNVEVRDRNTDKTVSREIGIELF